MWYVMVGSCVGVSMKGRVAPGEGRRGLSKEGLREGSGGPRGRKRNGRKGRESSWLQGHRKSLQNIRVVCLKTVQASPACLWTPACVALCLVTVLTGLQCACPGPPALSVLMNQTQGGCMEPLALDMLKGKQCFQSCFVQWFLHLNTVRTQCFSE